jgi:hypothetical protein
MRSMDDFLGLLSWLFVADLLVETGRFVLRLAGQKSNLVAEFVVGLLVWTLFIFLLLGAFVAFLG